MLSTASRSIVTTRTDIRNLCASPVSQYSIADFVHHSFCIEVLLCSQTVIQLGLLCEPWFHPLTALCLVSATQRPFPYDRILWSPPLAVFLCLLSPCFRVISRGHEHSITSVKQPSKIWNLFFMGLSCLDV